MIELADLPSDDFEQPDLPWHLDPRDKDPASEEMRQRQFLALLAKVSPCTIAWAVPNAARRSRWEVGKAKREGMMAGALDLTVTWSNGSGENAVPGSAYLEFKCGRGMPTPAQRRVLNRLYEQGHHCGVFRTADSAIAFLAQAGMPVRMREGRL